MAVIANISFVCVLLLAAQGTSGAQDMSMGSPPASSGLGVGVESMLSGPSGPTLVYQRPNFHLEGILGVYDRDDTTVLFAGRFYYQMHAGQTSDFSLGGGLGLLNTNRRNDANSTDTHVEVGAKIRLFLAPNVALSTSLGLSMVLGDGEDELQIVGRLQGSMGITYFFF